MKRFLTLALLLGLVGGLPACALVEDKIDLQYQASASRQPVEGASAVTVAVAGQDGRPSNRQRVSVKKNGYGMEMASIVPTSDVVAGTAEMVSGVLQRMGFRTGSDRDGTVTVELQRLWNDFKTGFFSGQAVAEANATLTVRGRNGRVAYTRVYAVESTVTGVMLASGDNAKLALEQALNGLAEKIAGDGELAAALLALVPSTSASDLAATSRQRRLEGVPRS